MAQLSDAVFEHTIERLYAAVTDSTAWAGALESVAVAFDTPRVAVMRTTPRMDGLFEMRQLHHDPGTEQQYRDHYWSMDPAHRLTRDAAVGQWLDVPPMFDPHTTPEPEYMDFAVRHGIRYVAGGKIWADATSVTVLGLQRPADHRAFDQDGAATFRRLGRHIGRATNMAWELQRANLSRGLSAAALDNLSMPVFAVDCHGHMVLANQRGEEHLRAHALLRLNGVHLDGAEPHVGSRLKAALQDATAHGGQTFSVSTRTGCWIVQVVPVAHYPGTTLIYLGESAHAHASGAALREAFGFSEAEADIASQLVAGMRPKVIAARRDAAESTVRTQIRRVFQKAGVRGVAGLVSLLATMPPVVHPAE